uniref:Uncharacterized protein n=1 Tax=Rhizophora mucronata TaxID=61149 RepID=A0A2P2R4L7_RHIMU
MFHHVHIHIKSRNEKHGRFPFKRECVTRKSGWRTC